MPRKRSDKRKSRYEKTKEKPAPRRSDHEERRQEFKKQRDGKRHAGFESHATNRSQRRQHEKKEKSFDPGSNEQLNKAKGIVIVHGDIQKHHKGFAFLLHQPEDIFIPPDFAQKLITGDKVKAWINSHSKEVLKVQTIKRGIAKFIGTYEAGFDKRTVMLVDGNMREEVVIKDRPNLQGLRHGHKVLVEITSYEPRLEGKILQTFGPTLAPKLDTLSVVIKSQWPQEFPSEVQIEAEHRSRRVQETAAKENYKGRKDFREKHFVTIDGADARDFDDAICVEKSNAGYILFVAVADVAEFVIPDSPLDKEAYGRATSVYFPEWVIPMLPEALSNGACSLRPDEEKLTLVCEMHYDSRGHKRSAKMYEAVIRSHRRCIYENVQKEFESGEAFWKTPYELFQLIRKYRTNRGSLDLDLPEAKIVLDENADTIDIRKSERLDSHRVIEEFMIAANESVSEIMEREGWPFVYRVHEPPEPVALARFEKFALALGIRPKFGDGTDPKLMGQFLETLKDNPALQILHYLLLRSLKQARYEPINLKHFGLASKAYSHFTSPIRRYPDLIAHRLIKRYLKYRELNHEQRTQVEEYLFEACVHCSKQERKAQDLDRKVTKIKKARFMQKHLGESFSAKITNISENGIFVELDQWFIEGLLPVEELGDDYFEYIEDKLMMVGKRNGKKYRLADPIEVTVLRTDTENGHIDFTLCK